MICSPAAASRSASTRRASQVAPARAGGPLGATPSVERSDPARVAHESAGGNDLACRVSVLSEHSRWCMNCGMAQRGAELDLGDLWSASSCSRHRSRWSTEACVRSRRETSMSERATATCRWRYGGLINQFQHFSCESIAPRCSPPVTVPSKYAARAGMIQRIPPRVADVDLDSAESRAEAWATVIPAIADDADAVFRSHRRPPRCAAERMTSPTPGNRGPPWVLARGNRTRAGVGLPGNGQDSMGTRRERRQPDHSNT